LRLTKAEVDYVSIVADWREFFSLCKINDAHRGSIPFEFWPHLAEMVDMFESNRFCIVLKSKQVGVSYVLAFYALWKALTQRSFNCLIISAGEKEAADLLRKCKFAYSQLPNWVKTSFPTDKWSETEITIPALGSRIVALPSTETPGVGETATLVIIDEWDFHKYPESDYATAEATVSAGGKIIGVSTVLKSKPDSLFKNLYKQAVEGQNNFVAKFLPWDVRPDRDDEWYETEKRNYIGREWQLQENYPFTPEQALSPLSAKSFFDEPTLKRLLDNCRDPIEVRENSVFIYSRFQPGVTYCAAADTSEGYGNDYQCMVLLGKKGLSSEVVALIHSNQIPTDQFAWMIDHLCAEYKKPILAVERNATGVAVLNKLEELHYPRLYKDEGAPYNGVRTAQTLKYTTLVELSTGLISGSVLTYYKPMVLEMFNFQSVPKGKGVAYEAVSGHDDTVSALMWAYRTLKYASPYTRIKTKTRLVQRQTAGMYV